MNNFVFYNPTRIVFGRGTIVKLSELVPAGAKVFMLSGRGSIDANRVREQVMSAIGDKIVAAYEGIQPNPSHEQCMKIIHDIRKSGANFLLAAGGGSVIDAAKYLAVAAVLDSPELAWDMVENKTPVSRALPVGVVLTKPASGSEMNGNAVISHEGKKEKRSLKSEKLFPLFTVLDPETTRTLSPTQLAHGVVDAYSHVLEQYLTFPVNAPLQDGFAESILLALLELGPFLVKESYEYEARATMMWAATCALNGFIACGVPQDWSSHFIAHELGAEYGMVHADAIAAVLPGVLFHMRREKEEKLVRYGRRVFGVSGIQDDEIAEKAIEKTEEFFLSLGQKVRLSDFGVGLEAVEVIAKKIGGYAQKIGEKKNIGEKEVREILSIRI